MSRSQNVTIRIFDTKGRQVKNLFYGGLDAGDYSFSWDATNESGVGLPSGVYIYAIQSGSVRLAGKMMFLK